MYFVYVIQSLKNEKRYTGFTNNLERRIQEHNSGTTDTSSTKNRGPFRLIYSEKVIDRKSAREREKFLKSGAGREYLEKLIPA